MARPIKTGLDYFPFDVDFFFDEKIVAINGEFGIKGEITTVKLLCAIYRNGYFIEWTDMLKYKLLKELPGVSAELVEQIVHRLVKWGFFDKALFDSAKVLTSSGIQRRYNTICVKMHRKSDTSRYWLLDASKPKASEKPAAPKPQPKPKATRKKPEPEAPTLELPKVPRFTPPEPLPLDETIQRLLDDTIWNEPVCMRYSLTPETLKSEIADFKQHCLCMGKQPVDMKDAKSYFCWWLQKKRENEPKVKPAKTAPVDYSSDGFGSKDI